MSSEVPAILRVVSSLQWNSESPTTKTICQFTDVIMIIINPLSCFFGIEGHVALDRNPEPGYNTLLFQKIPGDILSACPNRPFQTLPGLLDSQAAMSDSYPNDCVPSKGGNLYHFNDGLWYDPDRARTCELPHERRTY